MSSFEEIHSECLRTGLLYEDPDFPADNSSLFYSRALPTRVLWKRPGELVDDPKMTVGGATRLDVVQGKLSNSWMLAAMGSLCQHQSLFERVVPGGQDFSENTYAGVFRFNIWQYGEWKEVIIDDRLPTVRGKLAFTHSAESGEFWSSLLEKAYVKLLGSYEALKLGTAGDAMEDFTGGVVEVYDLNRTVPADLFQIMQKSQTRQSLMGCTIFENVPGGSRMGLLGGHYSVTSVQKVRTSGRRGEMDVFLIRLRNPKGNDEEWTGPWSDQSSEWELLSDSEKRKLDINFARDGEFWISCQDMVRNFHRLEICHLSPDTGDDDGEWELLQEIGSWRRNQTAGGSRDNPNTFWKNPQYRIEVADTSDDGSHMGTIVVALMQERKEEQDMLTIGFTIYKVEEGDPDPLKKDFFSYHQSAARSHTFISQREISERFELLAGSYCIVPSTFDPNEEGDFFLRVFNLKNKEDGTGNDATAQQSTFPSRVARRAVAGQDQDAMNRKYSTFFNEMAGDDSEIDARELQTIFNAAYKKQLNGKLFPLTVCQSLISAVDTDKSGKLGFDEFKELLMDAKQLLGVFNQYQQNAEGLTVYQLRDALADLGFPKNKKLAEKLKSRFSTGTAVLLPDFLAIVTRLNVLSDIFNKTKTGPKATFTHDEMLEKLSIV